MSVKDYNKEASLNVSISGINIAEGCAPSGINDAIRQLMADVKEESEALDSKKLERSGGTMTGPVRTSVDDFIRKTTDDGYLCLTGATDSSKGARIVLSGQDRAGLGGRFSLVARDQSGEKVLAGTPSGSLSWGNNEVLTSAGGEVAGLFAVKGSTLSMNDPSNALSPAQKVWHSGSIRWLDKNNKRVAFIQPMLIDDGSVSLHFHVSDGTTERKMVFSSTGVLSANDKAVLTSAGGTVTGPIGFGHGQVHSAGDGLVIENNWNGRYGPIIVLKDNDGVDNGSLWLAARNPDTGSWTNNIEITSDRGVLVNNSPLLTLVASWRSGNNWYRKYNDGWIEQGGYFADADVWDTETVSLHTPFAAANYTVLCQQQYDTTNNDYQPNVLVRARTTTSFTVESFPQGIFWYACGF